MDECVAIEIDPQDLQLAIYIIGSGVIRIKELSICKPDCYDQRAIKYGKRMLDALLKEYRTEQAKHPDRDNGHDTCTHLH